MARGRVRIPHLADRLTSRGGAYVHLLSVLAELARSHEVLGWLAPEAAYASAYASACA